MSTLGERNGGGDSGSVEESVFEAGKRALCSSSPTLYPMR
jgi:hypothetical protein